jgi:hypothetical protein
MIDGIERTSKSVERKVHFLISSELSNGARPSRQNR